MQDITRLQPVRSLLLLDTTQREETSSGGIIMPVMPAGSKITRTTKYGTIVAVGPDVDVPGLVVGARVVVAKYACDHINQGGNRYHFAEASQVMAIIATVDDLDITESDDPTPWCAICGSMTRAGCKCPPTAENE